MINNMAVSLTITVRKSNKRDFYAFFLARWSVDKANFIICDVFILDTSFMRRWHAYIEGPKPKQFGALGSVESHL